MAKKSCLMKKIDLQDISRASMKYVYYSDHDAVGVDLTKFQEDLDHQNYS